MTEVPEVETEVETETETDAETETETDFVSLLGPALAGALETGVNAPIGSAVNSYMP